MRGRVTIKDVARRAGVSVGTVSHHLTAAAPVAGATADRIDGAIADLGYRVDLGARGLRSRRTHSVGLVLPNISNPFYAEVARAVEHALWARGYQTFLCDASEDAAREQAHLDALLSRRVDGIILIRSGARPPPGAARERNGPPVIHLDRAAPGQPSITTDNRRGGALAARHLAELGHRRIAVLAGEPSLQNVRQRLEGFERELGLHGLALDPALVRSGPQALTLGRAAGELFQRGAAAAGPAPTAIFATNDVVAIGAWRTLLELGLRVPQDVSLVGFDDIEMSGLLVPALTTVRQDTLRLGGEAAALLLRLLAGEPAPRRPTLIPVELVIRGSTGPASGGRASATSATNPKRTQAAIRRSSP
jgi:LacI family transcriptional regulator